MSRYIATVKRLVAAGYPRDKALACVFYAFGLSPEQLATIDCATKKTAA